MRRGHRPPGALHHRPPNPPQLRCQAAAENPGSNSRNSQSDNPEQPSNAEKAVGEPEAEKSDRDSVEIWSGFTDGQLDMDLDRMKSEVSLRSIYQKAYFDESEDLEDLITLEEPDLTALARKLLSDYWDTTEVHMSTDQSYGSEIIVPSSDTAKPLFCKVSAWMGFRPYWMASLGHSSVDAGGEIVYNCDRPTAASATGTATAAAATAAASKAAASTAATDRGLSLRFNFQPDNIPMTPEVVLKMCRLAYNLRTIMFSRPKNNSSASLEPN